MVKPSFVEPRGLGDRHAGERNSKGFALGVKQAPHTSLSNVLPLRSRYAGAAATGRPGRSRSGGGGAGFCTPFVSCDGTSSRSSSIVHMPFFWI